MKREKKKFAKEKKQSVNRKAYDVSQKPVCLFQFSSLMIGFFFDRKKGAELFQLRNIYQKSHLRLITNFMFF